ncbi:MAG TPA: hypothetical protein VKR43_03085 [Bryobacteraceae bacterium]|nr:hypothetical protein [Bryobacteraceae bacterium]
MRAVLGVVMLSAVFSFADTITLRDGRAVNGSYLGGDSRSVRVAVGDRVDTYRVEEISTIVFGDPTPPAPIPPPAAVREERRDEARIDAREARREEQRAATELASGTAITVRMIDSVDSERDRMGQTFRASLDEPVVDASGNTIIPRGADAMVKLVDDQQSGKLAGKTILTLNLQSVQVNGQTVEINTQNVTEQSGSRTARSAKVIGGTAIAGAIIGAIAGGGKGAAIGTAAGAGAGTVAEVATKGQRVRIPSETRLTFTLQQPVNW